MEIETESKTAATAPGVEEILAADSNVICKFMLRLGKDRVKKSKEN